MARQFYCSKCGINLKCIRKALKNKMLILDLIEPHECIEGHEANIKDAEKPVDRVLVQPPIPRDDSDIRPFVSTPQYSDRRESKLSQVSTAPRGILGQVKGGIPPIDDEGEGDL